MNSYEIVRLAVSARLKSEYSGLPFRHNFPLERTSWVIFLKTKWARLTDHEQCNLLFLFICCVKNTRNSYPHTGSRQDFSECNALKTKDLFSAIWSTKMVKDMCLAVSKGCRQHRNIDSPSASAAKRILLDELITENVRGARYRTSQTNAHGQDSQHIRAAAYRRGERRDQLVSPKSTNFFLTSALCASSDAVERSSSASLASKLTP